MTISDFLNLPNFSDLNLLAGENGLDRELTNVTVVDTPDGTNWLNGGEFVITTAYMLHEEKDLLEFLQVLHEKQAAGVGIKENRYITTIPEAALKMADELNLPLISVPSMDLNFTLILEMPSSSRINGSVASAAAGKGALPASG